MTDHITVVRVSDDPFGRGEPTVFYTDSSFEPVGEVYYLWLSQWPKEWPQPEATS
jgi:hypothetical protein